MKPLYKPEYEPLLRSSLTLAEVARKIGVGPQTVANWRHRIAKGRPMPTERYATNYPLIDKLIADGGRPVDIARAAGCSPTLVSRRMKGLTGGGRTREIIHTGPREVDLIPPADRLSLALRLKTEGWTPRHREAFLHSQEGARWADMIRGRV